MRSAVRKRPGVLVAIVVGCLPSASGQQTGLSPQWDVQKTVGALAVEARRLKPVLDQVKPQEWLSKGAPETYLAQWKSTRSEIDSLVITTENLAREPERLTLALETFFRLEALEAMAGSLGDGIRKYQNPALADLLQGVMAQNSGNRQTLARYILDLAAAKELEFKVIDQEAQRCRGAISRQPAPAGKADRKVEPK